MEQNTVKVELLACPFCGSDKVGVWATTEHDLDILPEGVGDYDPTVEYPSEVEYEIGCMGCDFCTGKFTQPSHVIDKWNSRPRKEIEPLNYDWHVPGRFKPNDSDQYWILSSFLTFSRLLISSRIWNSLDPLCWQHYFLGISFETRDQANQCLIRLAAEQRIDEYLGDNPEFRHEFTPRINNYYLSLELTANRFVVASVFNSKPLGVRHFFKSHESVDHIIEACELQALAKELNG